MGRRTLRDVVVASRPVRATDLALFLHQLALLLNSGVDMVRSFEVLSYQEANPRLRDAVAGVGRSVATAGCLLSSACSTYPGVFPPQVVMLMELGEQGAGLSPALEHAANLLERQSSLSRRVAQALSTAVVTLLVSFLLVFVVFKTVIPRFMGLFEGMPGAQPWVTRLAMQLVAVVNNPVFSVGLLGIAAFVWLFKESLHQTVGTLMLRHPVTGRIVGQVLAVPFCHTLAAFQEAGVPMLQGLDLLARSTRYDYHAYHLHRMILAFQQGGTLAEATQEIPYFPRVVWEMMAVGEETGSLSRCLSNAGRLLDDNTQELMGRVVTLLEPLALLGVGGVILFFVAAVFLPIYGLLQVVH